MSDFEQNWKNSEVITLFAENFFADPPTTNEKQVDEPIVEKTVREVREYSQEDTAPYLAVQAELEIEAAAQALKNVLASVIESGNHKAALMIEKAICELYEND